MPLQNVQAACAKCGKPLSISKISERYSYCYRCKSCGGYSAVYIRDGNIRVDPIKTSHVRVSAGIFFFSGGFVGICTICIAIGAVVNIRTNPLLFGVGIMASLITAPCTWLFLWMGLLRLRGDPSFGFLHKSIKQSVAYNKFVQCLNKYGERVAVAFATVICWIGLGQIYRYGGMSYLIGCGTLLGPTTLLLTYYAFGGNIPLKWRHSGIRRLTVIPIVFFISLFAFFVVVHFFPPNPN